MPQVTSFNKRRKTLLNGITTGGLGFTKEDVLKAFETCGLDPAVRGEKLGLPEFAALADALGEPAV